MKRYLFSILFVLFAFGGICTFFIYNALDPLPKFKLVTLQGNPEEVRPLELSGHYNGRIKSEFLEVSLAGSEYRSKDKSFRQDILNTRSWFFNNTDIQQLVKEHRSFMRGKEHPNGFYNDEEWLIYVDSEMKAEMNEELSVLLNISYLNKSTKQTGEYELSLARDNQYYGFFINDVQLIEDRLHIFSTLYSREITSNLLQINVVDFNSGKLISSHQLSANNQNEEDHIFRLSVLPDETLSAPSDSVVIMETEEKITSREGQHSYTSTTVAERFYNYSYQSGEMTALPEFISQNSSALNTIYSLRDQVFTIIENDANRILFSRYDLNTGAIEEEYAVIHAADLGVQELGRSMRSEADRLYMLLQKDTGPLAVVADLQTGKLLYKGEVVLESPLSKKEEILSNFRMMNLNIKR